MHTELRGSPHSHTTNPSDTTRSTTDALSRGPRSLTRRQVFAI